MVKLLQDAFMGELRAVRQYTCHAALQEAAGFTRLAAHTKEEAREELGHAELLAGRMAVLGISFPDSSLSLSVKVGSTPSSQIANDLSLETDGIRLYKDLISEAMTSGDYATAELAIKILVDEEKHAAWLRAQQGLIAAVGEDNWMQSLI